MATDNPLIYSNANNNSIMYSATVYNLLLFFSHANCYLHTSISLLNVNKNVDLCQIVSARRVSEKNHSSGTLKAIIFGSQNNSKILIWEQKKRGGRASNTQIHDL